VAGGRRAFGLEVVERDGRWHLRGTVAVKDRSRRIRKSTGLPSTGDNLDAAHEIRRQVEAQTRDELLFGLASSVSLSVATDTYVARPRQRPLNAGDVDRLTELASVFGHRMLNRIDDQEWLAWIDRRMKGNAPVTRERYIDLIMAFLAWCRKRPRQWLAELPVIERDRAARQRTQRRARRVGDLRPELIERLMRHAPPHLKGQLAIMWSTGARVSSVLYGCRLCDYLAAPGREQISFHNTKNGRRVDAAVHPWAAAVMTEYLEWRGRLHDREAPLFLTDRRQPYARKRHGGGQMKTAFRAMINRAGRELRREALVEAARLRQQGRFAEARTNWLTVRSDLELLAQLTPHWFRHRLATALVHDVRAAMEQGGWEDYRSVVGYSHDVPERRRSLIGQMDAPGGLVTRGSPSKRKSGRNQQHKLPQARR
jgi:site-specific recombinase XerD